LKISNNIDFGQIQSRDPELEAKRLFFGGLSKKEQDKFNWENKYRLAFSVPITSGELRQAVAVGMLAKSELKDGVYYWGVCRNARVARWSTALQEFEHLRFKGGWNISTIAHPEAEVAHLIFASKQMAEDTFIPWYEVEPKGFEKI
jgi:hypothetical protein